MVVPFVSVTVVKEEAVTLTMAGVLELLKRLFRPIWRPDQSMKAKGKGEREWQDGLARVGGGKEGSK